MRLELFCNELDWMFIFPSPLIGALSKVWALFEFNSDQFMSSGKMIIQFDNKNFKLIMLTDQFRPIPIMNSGMPHHRLAVQSKSDLFGLNSEKRRLNVCQSNGGQWPLLISNIKRFSIVEGQSSLRNTSDASTYG